MPTLATFDMLSDCTQFNTVLLSENLPEIASSETLPRLFQNSKVFEVGYLNSRFWFMVQALAYSRNFNYKVF